MIKFLVERGIDSLSVNADAASEIANYVAEIEKEQVKDTDEEPRQYQPKKEIVEKESTKEDFVKPQNVLEEIKENIEKGEEAIEEVVEKIEENLKDKEENVEEFYGPEFPKIRGAEDFQQDDEDKEDDALQEDFSKEEDEVLDIF